MIEKDAMRKRDFITSLVLIGLSLGILFGASRMPMKGNYGGVQNVWYVSPALMPFIIGAGLLILSIILLINSIVTKGAKAAIEDFKVFMKQRNKKSLLTISDNTEQTAKISQLRVLLVVLEFFILIFLFIPRVDFLISLIFFLMSTIGMFYLDRVSLFIRVGKFLGISAVAFSLLAYSGFASILVNAFEFTLDIVVFFMTVYVYILLRKQVGSDLQLKKKLKIVTIVAIGIPLLVTVVFRYSLLVPLPVEGLFFDRICNSIYYAIR